MSTINRNRANNKIGRAAQQDRLATADAVASWKQQTKDDSRKTALWRERMKAQLAGSGENQYLDGMREAHRVLKTGGFLFVKCQDTVQDGKNIWTHVDLINAASGIGFAVRDLAIVKNASAPATRWSFQRHFRKHHSYFAIFSKGGDVPSRLRRHHSVFLIMRKGGHFPFGLPSVEKR